MKLAQYKSHLIEELSPIFEENEIKNYVHILFQTYLKIDRATQVLEQDREISENELGLLNSALDQLKQHKPIDYIINETIFYGRAFYVDERVLIPRSETEELVLMILENEETSGLTILDIGSGSGCIPITLKLEGQFEQVYACEISASANEVAKKNAAKMKVQLSFSQLDILTEIPERQYDIVVSNPPYVKEEELTALDKNVKDYEPAIALAPIGDPLTFYKRMVAIAPQLLKPNGRFYWEIHEDLGKEVVQLLKEAKFSDIELQQDLYGRDRLVRAVYQ